MAALTDYFWLNRSGRYANPLNSNDRLPIVYGDLTDATSGNWTLPCIDTVNFVYCFAGHETLSVANGNAISIYADGVLVAGAGYSFNAANNYESEGTISTIDFTADQSNAIITARGRGKPTTSGGATLIENIVDFIYDFLTVENSFPSSLFNTTKKALASNIFSSQAYEAAGAIVEDETIWNIVQKMIGSFYGSAYLDSEGLLCLDIDDGTLIGKPLAGIFEFGDTEFGYAKQRITNLINRCPASYAYNYATGQFRRHTDDSAYADMGSVGIFGTQEPATPFRHYWTRDLASVNTIQSIITGRFARPVWEATITDYSFKRTGVDVGDIVAATAKGLYDSNGFEFINHIWKVLSVSPDYRRNKITYRGLSMGCPLTLSYYANGSINTESSALAGGAYDQTLY